MTSEMERLDKYRSQMRTRSGPASYVDTGGPGRPVLFVHGVGTSSYLWRNVIAQLDGERRESEVLVRPGRRLAVQRQVDRDAPALSVEVADDVAPQVAAGADAVDE